MKRPSEFIKTNKGKIVSILLVLFLIVGILYTFGELRSAAAIPKRIVYKATGVDVYQEIIRPIAHTTNYIDGLRSNPERITIDIKNNDFQKLSYKREIALAEGILITSDDDYVPAKIRYKDQTVNVKLRLKGDWTDHLKGDKWSFRIKVQDDDTLFGMKQFSLHKPETRRYANEWLIQQAFDREGIIALRYDFIDVTINGKHKGIYAIEEHFEKRLIENNKLREGPIIRFNEDLTWAYVAMDNEWDTASDTEMYFSSDIDSFQTGKILKDPTLHKQFVKATYLLESFRNGSLNTSDVFDIDKLAKFVAISDLMGANHGNRWHNKRFYYNPITSKLEPICFDSMTGDKIDSLMFTDNFLNPLHQKTIFKDPIFFAKYVQELEHVSQPSYLDELFSELDTDLKRNIDIIHKDYPVYHFSNDIFYQNQIYIRNILNPVKGLHAYFYQNTSNGSIILEVGNIHSMPLEILNVTYNESQIFEPKEKVNILQAKTPSEPVHYEKIEFILPEGFNWSGQYIDDLRLNYKLLGISRLRNETIFPWSHLSDDFIATDFIRQKTNIEMFDFLFIDNVSKKILVKHGNWELNSSLIIPAGYTFICEEGAQLDLKNNATILSYSPLRFFGTEDYPILITSSDSSGQGIAVLNADEKSILENVVFNNLSAPSQHGWQLTGAITFYESPVEIHGCQFSNNKAGDDMLNIVRSEFEIENTLFKHTLFDALDIDFGKGAIFHTSFVESGNDAMDFSGSVVDVTECFVNGTGDKGVSIGENSIVKVKQTKLTNCYLAVASKDMSNITLENIEVFECEVGFALYQKKSEFGPSSITASSVAMINVTAPYIIEEGSTLFVDNQKFDTTQKNVWRILYDKT